MLIAVGVVNLLSPLLAALLQKRFDPRTVAIAGPIAQAVLALTISRSTTFAPYAVATSLWVFAMIFTHTFLFGLLARIDTTGRAVASTPAIAILGRFGRREHACAPDEHAHDQGRFGSVKNLGVTRLGVWH